MKKKKIWMKIAVILLAVIVSLLLIWGTNVETFFSEPSSGNGEKENQTLKWYINYSWMDADDKNAVSEYIAKTYHVNIEFVIPKGNESEKLQTMIDTETLPDLVTVGWWEPENQEMINQEQVYALNQLADKYDTSFYDYVNPYVMDWYTQSDGNIYGYPNYSYSYQDYMEDQHVSSNENFLVRKDIYEAIGSPDMTTPEGFSDAVRRAAELFPNVNGEPLIPIGADEFTNSGNNSFDLYLQNFLAVPYEKDGKYYDRNTDAEYIRWLKVFRQLGEEGYLKNDIFVDKRSQLEEKIGKGRYFCLFYQSSDIEQQQKEIYDTNPDQIYIAVAGPRNSSKENPVLPVSGINGWTVTYISKNCTCQKEAIQIVSFLLSKKGQKLVSEEGQDDFWMLLDESENTEFPEYIRQMKNWSEPYSRYLGQYELNFGENLEMTNVQKKLQGIWADTLPHLLLAKSEAEFDRIVNDYIKRRNASRYGEYEAAATALIQKNKSKMGIKE